MSFQQLDGHPFRQNGTLRCCNQRDQVSGGDSAPTGAPSSERRLNLTQAQAALLSRMGFVPHVLKNDDELRPKWWLEGGGAVKANVAQSLCRLGFVRISGHWGGMPGMDGFTVTAAGQEALRRHEGRSSASSSQGGQG